MKLTLEQTQHVADQLQGQAIPEEHPNTPQLREAIGDHTFFLNNDGLHIVEPPAEEATGEDASALRIASWSRDQEGQLFLHEPQPAQAVSLKPSGPDVA
jgi:hypothetical protein